MRSILGNLAVKPMSTRIPRRWLGARAFPQYQVPQNCQATCEQHEVSTLATPEWSLLSRRICCICNDLVIHPLSCKDCLGRRPPLRLALAPSLVNSPGMRPRPGFWVLSPVPSRASDSFLQFLSVGTCLAMQKVVYIGALPSRLPLQNFLHRQPDLDFRKQELR